METIRNDSLWVVKGGTDIARSSKARKRIGRDVRRWREAGVRTVLVSSGAKTAGAAEQFAEGTDEWRRAVRTGQERVDRDWRKSLAPRDVAARLMRGKELTDDDTRSIVDALAHESIPLINEDDTACPETLLGNNDQLAAACARRLAETNLFSRVGLVIMTDVAGLCENPSDPDTLIPEVDTNNPSRYEGLASGASGNGTGGMVTKFEACLEAARCGIPACIVNGALPNPLTAALHRQNGTYFPPNH